MDLRVARAYAGTHYLAPSLPFGPVANVARWLPWSSPIPRRELRSTAGKLGRDGPTILAQASSLMPTHREFVLKLD